MTKSNGSSRPESDEELAINSSRPPRLNIDKAAASSDAPRKEPAPKK